jgi:hopanoid biosynthesis associated RND transporter like protein HpnN
MLDHFLAGLVAFCIRWRWRVIVAAIVIASASAIFSERRFAVDTDINALLSPLLPWRQREIAYRKIFPQEFESILAVVQGSTLETARAAAERLMQRLRRQPELFRSVEDLAASAFFIRNSLLTLPSEQVANATRQLATASPAVRTLTSDPSLRGLTQVLQEMLEGVKLKRTTLDGMAWPMTLASDTLDAVHEGKPASFSWRVLLNGRPATPAELREIVVIWPALDYKALEPGEAATETIRRVAAEVKADVRLTGPVPIEDKEFASLSAGAAANYLVSGLAVLVIIWLALRSFKLVASVTAAVLMGLAITAAIGLLLVGAFNPISLAFAVLSVGLGADFAIQFSIRYRAERHDGAKAARALVRAAETVGKPLMLAAGAAVAGFFSFLPTAYSGLAELGLIAGCGMIVAYIVTMTFLPALICATKPPPEPRPLGYARLAPVDGALQRHRIAVVATISALTLAGLPALGWLKFDFNPMSLRNPRSEAMTTLKDLRGNPNVVTDAAELLVKPADAAAMSQKLAALPQVGRVRSLASFIPADQDAKLAMIKKAADALTPALGAPQQPQPTDAENVAALGDAAAQLRTAADRQSGPGAQAANRLGNDLSRLSAASAQERAAAQSAFVAPLKMDLSDLRDMLKPDRAIKQDDLPAALVRGWKTSDGRERLEITPKGNLGGSAIVTGFAGAVLSVAPQATGQPVMDYEWGNAIFWAFGEAGAWALGSIFVLLWIVLRRLRDVLLTLTPLLAAAAVTLEICALTGFALNYANIIALPVLLGIGVAFKIYYVMAWRRGETNFLQSSLTRAVVFSALITATAFGSLMFSRHPGTASMGKLLALSLACTLASAALFQPALMGPPRDKGQARDDA